MLNESAFGTRGDQTRQKLIAATLSAIREVGFSGLSARVVAGVAGVNQALIFYHFDSMDGLVGATCRQATAERVAVWSHELEQVEDLGSLVRLARRLHAQESEEGNVSILAQALAAARSDPALASVVGEALGLWLEPLEATVRRILEDTVLSEVVSAEDVARTVAAAFVGMELFDGVVPRRDQDPFAVLERLAVLGQLALEPGRVTRAAIRRRLRSATG